jgi:autotransporter-associated beta strand protein
VKNLGKHPYYFTALLCLAGAVSELNAATYTWTGNTSSVWNVASNWNPSTDFPRLAGDVAQFSALVNNPITLGQPITIGTLNILTSATIIIGDSNLLTFSNGGTATINMSTGSSRVNSPVNLIDPLDITFSGILRLSGNISGSSLTVNNNAVSGVLLLEATNTYSATNINTASIVINAASNLSGPVTFTGNGFLTMASSIPLITNSFTINNMVGKFRVAFGATATIGGQITGPGTLEVNLLNDDGTLILTGANNYSGGTTVLTGTLQGNTTSLQGDILNNSILIFDQTTTGTFPDNITGTGALQKTGSGLLTLSNSHGYTGNTMVNQGRLNVNSSLASPTTTVNSGATLGGTGSLQAVVVNGGTIAAGNSIGTLQMTSFSANGSATTQVEIDPTTNSLYVVMNNATLGGDIFVVQDGAASAYPPSKQYTFLTAGSITSSFNPTVLGGLPGFQFSLIQNANSIVLAYISSLAIPTSGLSGNALTFANYLNSSAPDSPATSLLARLTGSSLQNALNSASPARNAFGTFITQNILFGVSQTISSHLIDQRYFLSKKTQQPQLAALLADNNDTIGAENCTSLQDPHSFWAHAFGEYNHLKSEDQNPSFNAYSGAALLGFDFHGSEHNLFGLGAGYGYTHLSENQNAGHQNINYYIANLYDTVYFPRGYVEFGLWGVYTQIHNYRHISFPGFDAMASATFHGWQIVPHLGFGYLGRLSGTDIEPFAQFDCAINWQESYQEHGAGSFNMSQQSQTSELLRSEAGLRFYQSKETDWGAWRIMEKISYVNLKTFNTGTVTSSIVGGSGFFTVESFRGTQNLGSAGLEFLWRFGKRKPVDFSLVYDGQMGSRYMSHEGMAKLSKDF